MKELVFNFVNQYALFAVLFILFLVFIFMWKMHSQLKRLNSNITGITENIQKYFDVILEDEPQEEIKKEIRRETQTNDKFLTQEEKEILLSDRIKQHWGDENLFNEIMQEYFS